MMKPPEPALVESSDLNDFSKIMQRDGWVMDQPTGGQVPRLNLTQENMKNSLGQLVLTLVKLLHELLERQGIRRIEAGSLTDDQIERLGVTLMKQAQEIDRLRREFGLEEEDLNIDLGPLGQLL
jgi:hypothetical protein